MPTHLRSTTAAPCLELARRLSKTLRPPQRAPESEAVALGICTPTLSIAAMETRRSGSAGRGGAACIVWIGCHLPCRPADGALAAGPHWPVYDAAGRPRAAQVNPGRPPRLRPIGPSRLFPGRLPKGCALREVDGGRKRANRRPIAARPRPLARAWRPEWRPTYYSLHASCYCGL